MNLGKRSGKSPQATEADTCNEDYQRGLLKINNNKTYRFYGF